jgi:putative alpha-1,2-mannosidase
MKLLRGYTAKAGGSIFLLACCAASIANHVSAQNKYVQSAQLNGKRLKTPWFSHAAIADGGSLVLEMGDKPNKRWGSTVAEAPPSMSQTTEAPGASVSRTN